MKSLLAALQEGRLIELPENDPRSFATFLSKKIFDHLPAETTESRRLRSPPVPYSPASDVVTSKSKPNLPPLMFTRLLGRPVALAMVSVPPEIVVVPV